MSLILETERLRLHEMSTEDAPFILELLNDPAWLQNIGDRGVRTLDDARLYIRQRITGSYERLGLGLYLVRLKADNEAIGVCGLLKRDVLEDYDLGYALLPAFTGKGYALEAATGVAAYAKNTLGLKRIVAFTLPENQGSVRVLEKLGMQLEGELRLTGDDEACSLYGLNF